MRTICDVCESAPAILFCAADEAALCKSCDDKVHKCNKLASRHVRVGLAIPSDVPFATFVKMLLHSFYCEIDGSSLCLQCDTVVHVGGKQTHKRYLLLRQRVEFPMDKANNSEGLALQTLGPDEKRKEQKMPKSLIKEKLQNHRLTTIPHVETMKDECRNINAEMIDLNARPLHAQGQPSSTQARGMHVIEGTSHHNGTVIHIGSFKGGPEK